MVNILVTGSAGFIGFHLSRRLLDDGFPVYGIDNLNDYYDVGLKEDRLKCLQKFDRFQFKKLDLGDRTEITQLFNDNSFDIVINLAAQAGVRYSLENPHAYVDSNLTGFVNILEGCRHNPVKHLIFASSSSVYGQNPKIPFAVGDNVDYPISLYAATKKANELLAYSYSHLYKIPTTGLRFFTVYGPWGRPDMAYFKFVRAIESGQKIKVFNYGNMERDFTYIDDVVEGMIRLIDSPPINKEDSLQSQTAPYKLYNIGNNQPVPLNKFITVIEQALGKTAQKELLPMQPGDVPRTYADVDPLIADVGFKPQTSIEEGISHFVKWYKSYYRTNP
ncbi:MAG: NAD-dependent epimerase [Cyanobacterium sp.]